MEPSLLRVEIAELKRQKHAIELRLDELWEKNCRLRNFEVQVAYVKKTHDERMRACIVAYVTPSWSDTSVNLECPEALHTKVTFRTPAEKHRTSWNLEDLFEWTASESTGILADFSETVSATGQEMQTWFGAEVKLTGEEKTRHFSLITDWRNVAKLHSKDWFKPQNADHICDDACGFI